MANTRSARKRVRQSQKRHDRNRAHLSRMRTAVKKLRTAVSNSEQELAQELLPKTLSVVDVTAQKGVIHRNAAARTKSRLTRAVQGLSAEA